jgi:hypothetical protein
VNRRFYAGLARRYQKVVSGGSDFHGQRFHADAPVGSAGVTAGQWAALQDAIARRQAKLARPH